MAKTTTRSGSTSAKKASKKVEWHFELGKDNFRFFLIGLAIIVLGYGLMATGITSDPAKHLETWNNPMAVIISPILLVVGYCVVIPYAIWYRRKDQASDSNNAQA